MHFPRQNDSGGSQEWVENCPDYDPPYYVAQIVLDHEGDWADPEDFRKVDFRNRFSLEGKIRFSSAGVPLNPRGRTGVCGRGWLGKWGPNLAADAIVTRVNKETGNLEFLAVKRKGGAWAIPGGMMDQGETPIETANRELNEEALDGECSILDAVQTYEGYMDGSRNTDNAWIETTAFHKHISWEESLGLKLKAQEEEVSDVKWMSITDENIDALHDDHKTLIVLAIQERFSQVVRSIIQQ